MNLFRKELKTGLKPFLFWTLGLFMLIFAGIVKSSAAMADGAFMTDLIRQFPRIVVAAMGMANVDIAQFGGFYAVLMQYVFILTAVYSTHLGNNAVSRESVDRTYEFLFTKPRTRSFILARKLLAALVFFTALCVLNFAFSVAAVQKLGIAGDYSKLFAQFSLAMWLFGIVFFTLAAMFSAGIRSAERGAKAGNLVVLGTYVLAVVYDLLEKPGLLRVLTPFRYFLNTELTKGTIPPLYAGLCVALSVVFLIVAFDRFERRDLGAL